MVVASCTVTFCYITDPGLVLLRFVTPVVPSLVLLRFVTPPVIVVAGFPSVTFRTTGHHMTALCC